MAREAATGSTTALSDAASTARDAGSAHIKATASLGDLNNPSLDRHKVGNTPMSISVPAAASLVAAAASLKRSDSATSELETAFLRHAHLLPRSQRLRRFLPQAGMAFEF